MKFLTWENIELKEKLKKMKTNNRGNNRKLISLELIE